MSPNDENFETRWLHESTLEHQTSRVGNLNAVKEFAYNSFDRLDKDGNGFIEMNELQTVLDEDGALNNREKSFVVFLLNNFEQISIMQDEGLKSPVDGISRADIELYFKLLATLL